jgi:hypothetical protein
MRKRSSLEMSTAPAFDAGDRVMVIMHSIDNTRVWRSTVLEYSANGDFYRVEWDDNFVSIARPSRLEVDDA